MDKKEEKIKNAFQKMDQNGDGEATKEEIKEMFKSMKGDFTDDEIDELVKIADANGDGKINFEEFTKAAMGKK